MFHHFSPTSSTCCCMNGRAPVFHPLEMACDPTHDFGCCYRCLDHVGIVLLSFETEDSIQTACHLRLLYDRRLTEARIVEHKDWWIGLWYTPLVNMPILDTIFIFPMSFSSETGFATRWFPLISQLRRSKDSPRVKCMRNRFHYICSSLPVLLSGSGIDWYL